MIVCLAFTLMGLIISIIGFATNTGPLLYAGTILTFIAACWWTASTRIMIRYWRIRR